MSQNNDFFFSPQSSTQKDQFKSVQEGRVTPFDEQSISPRSNNNQREQYFQQNFNPNFYDSQNPPAIKNFAQWDIPEAFEINHQSEIANEEQEINISDFEDQLDDDNGNSAGTPSLEQPNRVIQHPETSVQRKPSRDLADIDDPPSVNASQQSQPFKEVSIKEKIKYMDPAQLPNNTFERQNAYGMKNEDLNKHFTDAFPIMTVSPDIPRNNQQFLAFTFHDPSQKQELQLTQGQDSKDLNFLFDGRGSSQQAKTDSKIDFEKSQPKFSPTQSQLSKASEVNQQQVPFQAQTQLLFMQSQTPPLTPNQNTQVDSLSDQRVGKNLFSDLSQGFYNPLSANQLQPQPINSIVDSKFKAQADNQDLTYAIPNFTEANAQWTTDLFSFKPDQPSVQTQNNVSKQTSSAQIQSKQPTPTQSKQPTPTQSKQPTPTQTPMNNQYPAQVSQSQDLISQKRFRLDSQSSQQSLSQYTSQTIPNVTTSQPNMQSSSPYNPVSMQPGRLFELPDSGYTAQELFVDQGQISSFELIKNSQKQFQNQSPAIGSSSGQVSKQKEGTAQEKDAPISQKTENLVPVQQLMEGWDQYRSQDASTQKREEALRFRSAPQPTELSQDQLSQDLWNYEFEKQSKASEPPTKNDLLDISGRQDQGSQYFDLNAKEWSNEEDMRTVKSSQTGSLRQFEIDQKYKKNESEYGSQKGGISNRYKVEAEHSAQQNNDQSREYYTARTNQPSQGVSPDNSAKQKEKKNPFDSETIEQGQNESSNDKKYEIINWEELGNLQVQRNQEEKGNVLAQRIQVEQGNAQGNIQINLDPIPEEDSMTQSHAIRHSQSGIQPHDWNEQQSIDESKLIQLSNKPNQESGNKNRSQPMLPSVQIEQLVEQLTEKIEQRVLQALKHIPDGKQKVEQLEQRFGDFAENLSSQISQFKDFVKQKDSTEFDTNFAVLQKLEMIQNQVNNYAEQLSKLSENIASEQQRVPLHQPIESIEVPPGQFANVPQSPFEMHLNNEAANQFQSPSMMSRQNPGGPPSGAKYAQSNYFTHSSPKGFIPVGQQQTHSRYAQEVEHPQEEARLQKYETHNLFRKASLRALEDFDVQQYRKQSIHETSTLVDTFELYVTSVQEPYEMNGYTGLRVIVTYKNKSLYDLMNFIVIVQPVNLRDEFSVKPEKISEQYLRPNQSIQQEFKFKIYDPAYVYVPCIVRYQINNHRYGIDPGRFSQHYLEKLKHTREDQPPKPFSLNSQNFDEVYASRFHENHIYNNRSSDISVGSFKRTAQFFLARPANRFFKFNFVTADELNEYQMVRESSPFFCRSLEELVIYHPWLVSLDEHSLGAKVFVHLKKQRDRDNYHLKSGRELDQREGEDNGHEFVIKVVMTRGNKCVVQMNENDLEQSQIQHFLNFLTYLFSQMF